MKWVTLAELQKLPIMWIRSDNIYISSVPCLPGSVYRVIRWGERLLTSYQANWIILSPRGIKCRGPDKDNENTVIVLYLPSYIFNTELTSYLNHSTHSIIQCAPPLPIGLRLRLVILTQWPDCRNVDKWEISLEIGKSVPQPPENTSTECWMNSIERAFRSYWD